MSIPYVTPAMLINAPLGISWSTIPTTGASAAAKLAEQTNIAWRATSLVDLYCNQPLRATLDVETVFGPDTRLTFEPNGVCHVLTSRWPIIAIIGARTSPSSAFPRQWSTIAVDQIDFDEGLTTLSGSAVAGASGAGASGVYIAGGQVGGGLRRGTIVELTYVNGWPHAGTTADVAASGTALVVDDVTGFTGAVATIYDGEFTETVTVTTVNGALTRGPGTINLAAGCTYAHAKGAVVSAIPSTVQQATLMFAAHIALERGATSLSVQSMPGGEEHHSGIDLATEAEIMLHPFKRVI